MAKIGKPKISINPSDLKKGIVNANKNLQKRSNNLEIKIKESEKNLKDLESQEKIAFNGLKQIQDRVATDEANAHSVAQTLSEYNQKLSNAKGSYSKVQLEESKTLKEIDKLSNKIEELNADVNFLEAKKSEYSNLKKEIDSSKETIAKIENDATDLSHKKLKLSQAIDSLQSNYDSKISLIQEESKKVSEEQVSLNNKSKEISKQIEQLDKDLDIKKSQYNVSMRESEDEVKVVISLISKKEDEYYKWERKVENVKNSVEEEQKRVNEIKENYAKWKIGALEEVARLKLKGKIDRIDKAGLGEILNG
jgi:chromosome segregation ATPase